MKAVWINNSEIPVVYHSGEKTVVTFIRKIFTEDLEVIWTVCYEVSPVGKNSCRCPGCVLNSEHHLCGLSLVLGELYDPDHWARQSLLKTGMDFEEETDFLTMASIRLAGSCAYDQVVCRFEELSPPDETLRFIGGDAIATYSLISKDFLSWD